MTPVALVNMLTPFICLFSISTMEIQPAVPKTIRLKFNLDSGQTISYKLHASTIQGAGDATGGLIYDIDVAFRAKRADAKQLVFTIRYSNIKVSNTPGSDTAGSMKAMVERMQGFEYGGTYDLYGKVIKPYEKGSNFAPAVAGGMYGGKAGILGIQYPKKSLSIGNKWTGEFDFSSVVTRSIQTMGSFKPIKPLPVAYELRSIRRSGDLTVADIAVKIVASAKLHVVATSGATNDPTTDISVKGQMTVDVATGMPIKYELAGTTKVKGEMNQVQNVRMRLDRRR